MSLKKTLVEEYKNNGLFIWPCEMKRPIMSGWSKLTEEQRQETLHLLDKDKYNVGYRTGKQTNGEYVITLDFDIYSLSDGKCFKSKETEKHFENICKLMKCDDGLFKTSTCKNYGIITNITKCNKLIERLQNKNSVKVDTHLEILCGMNSILPPSITECKIHDKKQHVQRAFLGNNIIFKCNEGVEKYLLSIIPEDEKPKIKHIKLEKETEYKQDNKHKLKRDQLIELEKILFDLPSSFYEDYEPWLNIGFSLKGYSNSTEVFNIWDKFSQQSKKYNRQSAISAWNSANNSKGLGSIIYNHKKHCPKRNRFYKLLELQPEINLLEGLDKIDIFKKSFNEKFITSSKGKITIFDVDIEKLEKLIIMIKSHTGSGKTTALKDITQTFEGKYSIRSICSRRTLTQFHAQKLKLNYYEDSDLEDPFTWQKIAVQLESILKCIQIEGDEYILILDEVNSLFDHIRNNMENMSTKREEIVNMLSTLINNAYAVFAFDADLSTVCIEFMQAMKGTKNIHLYINEFIEKRCSVIEYRSESVIYKKMIDSIENYETVYICSDMNNDFRIKIRDNIKKKYPDREIVYYSADEGDKKDFKSPDSWKGKIIMFTPTVLYGIDINQKGIIFGFYYGNHLNALQIVQQINRLRKPYDINLYFKNKSHENMYNSFDELQEAYIESEKELSKLIKYERPTKSILTSEDDKIRSIPYYTLDTLGKKEYPLEKEYKPSSYVLSLAYERYFLGMKYLDERLKSIRYYTLEILEKKGHTICYNMEEGEIMIEVDKEAKKQQIEEALRMLLTGEDISNDIVYELYKKRLEYLCHDVPKFKTLDKEQQKLISSIITSNHKFEAYLNYITFRDSKDIKKNLKENPDYIFHKITCKKTKIISLVEFAKSMNINNILDLNYKRDYKNIKSNKEKFKVPQTLKTSFRLTKKIYNEDITYDTAYKLLLNCTYNLFDFIMNTNKVKNNGSCDRVKEYSDTVIEMINTIRPKIEPFPIHKNVLLDDE